MSKTSKSPYISLVAGILIAGLAMPFSANVQATVLEEMIVTAQKREESLQEVPIAVTAFSRTELEEIGITGLDGISKAVPNLNLTSSLGYSVNAIINIRGNQQRSNNLSRDTAVGVYVDGVPISKTTGSIFDAVDLERVEVLRGPQGTLYGKNTIGGAMNLITRKPSGEFGADLKVGLGKESLREFRAAIDTNSVGEVGKGLGKLSARLSAFSRERDGFYKNTDPSREDFDNRDQTGARVALKLDVTENFTAEYSFDTFDMNQTPTFLPRNNGMPASQNKRPKSIANDSALNSDLDVSGHSLTLSYDIPSTALGDLTLKSITATREFDNDARTDFDGSATDLLRFVSINDYSQTSQEFQLIGSTESVDWVAGLFFFEDDWSTINPRWVFQLGGNGFDTDERSADEESIAAFGQITWTPPAFDKKLDMTFGIRSTKEDKKVNRRRIDISNFANPTVGSCSDTGGVYLRGGDGCPILDAIGNVQQITAEDSWSETTPMVVAAWNFNENVNGYAKVVSGFRSGGFNGVASNEAAFRTPFNPETMTTYELGLKSRFANDRVQVNAAFFKNDFKDFQTEVFVPELIAQNIVNAGEAEMSGVELEVRARPNDHWEIALNLAWLDTEYDVFMVGGVNVANEREFPYSPEQSGNAMVKYMFSPKLFGTLSARVDYSWKDDHFFGLTPNEAVDIESYGLLDARISLDEIPVGNGSMKVSLWGKNLNDEEYWEAGLDVRAFAVVQWADPKSYGIDFSYSF